jgi:predicted LPLAT superfamily acyltransferase
MKIALNSDNFSLLLTFQCGNSSNRRIQTRFKSRVLMPAGEYYFITGLAAPQGYPCRCFSLVRRVQHSRRDVYWADPHQFLLAFVGLTLAAVGEVLLLIRCGEI